MSKIISFYESRERYKALRLISALFNLIGSVLLLIGTLLLIFGVNALLGHTPGGLPQEPGDFGVRPVGSLYLGVDLRVLLSLVWSAALMLAGLQHIAMGALCRLFIHLEENTRASAQLLDKVRMRLESHGEGVEPLFRT